MECVHDNDHAPCTWKGLGTPDGRSASFTCPKCHTVAHLDGHAIASDGKVTPSVVCPNRACDYHEWLKLVGWSPTAPPTPSVVT